jgi:ABC-type sugar transport system substrate-binding protein
MKKTRLVAAGIAILLIFSAILSWGDQTTNKKRTYYFVGVVNAHPYWLDAKLGFAFAEKVFNCNIIWVGPQTWDIPAQVQAMEQTIPKKPDGIITCLFDSEPVPGVKRAMKEGIPVVVINATVPDSGAFSYVGMRNSEAGLAAAKLLIKYSGNGGKVGAVTALGLSNVDERLVAFKDYLSKNGKWDIVSIVDGKGDTQASIDAATGMFNAHPDVNAVIGFDSSAGTGISVAMENLKLDPKKISVICNDREDALLRNIKKGTIKATIIAKTALMSYHAVEMLDNYNNLKDAGQQLPLSTNNLASGANPFPSYVDTGFEIITKDNVDFYLRENMPTEQDLRSKK